MDDSLNAFFDADLRLDGAPGGPLLEVDGLPLGLSLLAAPGGDAMLLAAATSSAFRRA